MFFFHFFFKASSVLKHVPWKKKHFHLLATFESWSGGLLQMYLPLHLLSIRHESSSKDSDILLSVSIISLLCFSVTSALGWFVVLHFTRKYWWGMVAVKASIRDFSRLLLDWVILTTCWRSQYHLKTIWARTALKVNYNHWNLHSLPLLN